MSVVGICGSDTHILAHGKLADKKVDAPLILGHEGAGILFKVGKNVNNLHVGDRVAVEPGVSCNECKYCKVGRHNLCVSLKYCASPPQNGNLTRYFVTSPNACFKLPDHVSLEEGALLQPLSIGVFVCKKAEIKMGSCVAIFGAGPIGLMSLIVAKAMGAGNILQTDLDAGRLQIAKKLGADEILKVTANASEKSLVKQIHDILGQAPDIVIDCTPSDETKRLAILTAVTGGTVQLVGLGSDNIEFPLMNALTRELTIRSIIRVANCYPAALDLVARGLADVKAIVTHKFKITEGHKAFEVSRLRLDNCIKVLIDLEE